MGPIYHDPNHDWCHPAVMLLYPLKASPSPHSLSGPDLLSRLDGWGFSGRLKRARQGVTGDSHCMVSQYYKHTVSALVPSKSSH